MEAIYKNDIFGSYQLACECLNDHERTTAFKQCIERLVVSGKNVLELGAGTGILLLIAARQGAKHVTAVEINKIVADIARANVEIAGFNNKINIINKDALKLSKSDIAYEPDVVIMEMITTGLIEELQIPAFNNLVEKQILNNNSICCPSAFVTFAMLANVDYNFYGFELRNILHQESWQRKIIRHELSEKTDYHFVDFNLAIKSNDPIPTCVEENIEFFTTKAGLANAVVLTSKAILDDKSSLGWTTAINIPIIIPLDDKKLDVGDMTRTRFAGHR